MSMDQKPSPSSYSAVGHEKDDEASIYHCPSCGHEFKTTKQGNVPELSELPAGVRFEPSDVELLQHLEGKESSDLKKPSHPLIDQFIPTIEGENGICYTHPENLPGVKKDGLSRHFFHRPSKAYTTGTRKRRKVNDSSASSEMRWHKTGKTRAIISKDNDIKGYKKILVLYSNNYGRSEKPVKTNWIMHQYHLGSTEEEKEGQFVVSKVFYQTQPRQTKTMADSI